MNNAAIVKQIQVQIDSRLEKLNKLPDFFSNKLVSDNISNNLFYVNGLLKNNDKAEDALKIVNNYFENLTFKLIYNPGSITSDLTEIELDYNWLIQTAEKKAIKFPIFNSATYDTLALLQIGKEQCVPLGLIGSSQGSLVIFNAILAFSLIDGNNKNYLKNCVKVCLVGNLVPKRFFDNGDRLLNSFLACVSDKDYLGSAFTQESKTPSLQGMGKHSIKWYLPVADKEKEYYRKKTNLDENEPYVRKDYFLNPEIGGCGNWLEPFLNIMMQD